MRKSNWLRGGLRLAFAGFLLLFPSMPVRAQGKDTAGYMSVAFVRVTDSADKINAAQRQLGGIQYGYRDGLSILGGWVNAGVSLEFDISLKANVNYLFLADGDLDAQDVDLAILDANGKVAKQDVRLNREAAVRFQPEQDGNYTLRLTLAGSRNNLPCVCAAVILDDTHRGWNIPLKNLDAAVGKIAQGLTAADNAAQNQLVPRRVDLRRSPNQWAFFGGVCPQGKTLEVFNIDLGKGDRLFMGAGDRFLQLIDLTLRDNQTKKILKQHTPNNAAAALDFVANGDRVSLHVRNARSNGPSVMVMAIFDIR